VLPLSEIGRRIRALREELGIPPTEIAAACGVEEAVIAQMEAGMLEPLPGDYVLIAARLLKVDFRYFISTDFDSIEQETRRIYRAVSGGTPKDLLAIRRLILFCFNEVDLEELLGVRRRFLQVTYPLSGSKHRLFKEQGPAAAQAERSRLKLGLSPISNVFDIIRSQGIRLSRLKLDGQAISGLTIVHPRAGTVVLVNYEEDLYRQFFSAAHEYAHALFDGRVLEEKGVLVSYRSAKQEWVELRANTFAAEFLLPREALNRYSQPIGNSAFNSTVERIARTYRVNAEPVAICAKEVGWIRGDELDVFKKNKPVVIARRDKRDPDLPVDLTPVQIERWEALISRGVSSYYVDLCRRALTQDAITFGRFAELLDLTQEEAAEFVQIAGLAL
jgi:Zn-dependent peptidase ImmA (M78 family)/transcriptional regulator with XRE-family HTH domain